MANFGIGLGAFTNGFAQGYGIRRQINADKRQEQQQQREDAKQQAFTDARSDYDKAIADDVLTQAGQQGANGIAGNFDADAAKQTAQQRVGSFTDYLYNKGLPKLIDTYVQNGDLQGAETLRKWGEDAKERKFMDAFGKTLGSWQTGSSSGDYKPFADNAMKLLNDGGYGVKATGYDLVKDDKGNTTGLTFKLKDGDREYSHTFNSMDEAAQFLAAQGDPRSRVKLWQSQTEAAGKFKTEMAKEEAKGAIGLRNNLALEDARADNRLRELSAKTQAKLDAVARGYGLDASGNPYRKGRSPEEFRQQLVLEISKDPTVNSISDSAARKAKIQELADAYVAAATVPPSAQQPGISGGVGAAPAAPAANSQPPVFR